MKYILFYVTLLCTVFAADIRKTVVTSKDFTISSSDENSVVAFTDIRTQTVKMVIPNEDKIKGKGFSEGTTIIGLALTESTVIIEGAAGVILIGHDNALRSKGYGSVWEVRKVWNNFWVVSGSLYSIVQNVFIGDDINLSAKLNPDATGPFTFAWYKNNQKIQNITTATLKIKDVQLSDAGIYRVEVSNSVGFVSSENFNLIVR